jgi:valine--pyruvate aminotransferase
MEFSTFGRKFTRTSGIVQLMDDLGEALASDAPMIMLGGGNPGHVPEAESRFREGMRRLVQEQERFDRLVGDYAGPQGDRRFIEALSALLNRQLGWLTRPENIALTNGSQTAFFFLFNLFGGSFEDGSHRRILLPLTPEYIGYSDVGVQENLFAASRPSIEFIDQHTFKYHVDFASIALTEETGAICVSRPTNPTGNVLTDREVSELDRLAHAAGIPLIIDNAYGLPFPNIVFAEARPIWNDNIVLCMSLSKLGLPAVRTGIVLANEEVIRAVSAMNAVVSLAPGSFGAGLVLDMVRSGEIIDLSDNAIKPFYRCKAEQAVSWFKQALGDLDFFIHKPEGAIFLWLWFRGLPIDSHTLYERLKRRGVLVIPGDHFFPGLREDWRHRHECIRVTYAQDDEMVRRGIGIIAEEVRLAYARGS